MRRRGAGPHGRLVAAGVACVLAAVAHAAPVAAPPRSLAALDEAFAAATRDLARRATAAGDEALARLIADWPLPAEADRQIVVAIPARLETPAAVDAPEKEALWRDFLAARRTRAEGLFAHALLAARAHAHVATREEVATAAATPEPAPLAQQSCAAIQLLHLALRDDPDHARAREAGGWVRRGDDWVWPEAARRLDRGEAYDAAFGWMPQAKLNRYRAGERLDRGRWVTAADDDARPRDIKHAREFHSDHWEIVTAARLDDAAALARRLEETRSVWRQVFGAFAAEPKDLEKRLEGRGRTAVHAPHAAILCADRRQYVAELEPLEPRVGITNGIYWTPTKTIWFFADAAADPPEPDPVTIHHEGAHQLFTEGRADAEKARQLAGERNGFWAIEAAACYLESLEPTAFGWTVGGRDAGRAPAAKERLDEGFYVPFAELCRLGRREFQAHERLQQLYSQIAGQADFLMNGEGGRYRESFVEYLARVYRGTADPDSLARLCKRSYADLDDAYRRHMAR
jgi:hypothetical protein